MSFKRLSSEIALLSILMEKPQTGYEINRVIKERDDVEMGFSSVYNVLRRMEGKKLVKSRNVVVRGRNQRRYEVTDGGKEMFQREITRVLSIPIPVADDLDLGISSILKLERGSAKKALDNYERGLQKQLASLLEGAPKGREEPFLTRMARYKRLYMLEAEVKFVENFKKGFEGQYGKEEGLSSSTASA
jgi:DNA-binding PadR family transcriptional regulator